MYDSWGDGINVGQGDLSVVVGGVTVLELGNGFQYAKSVKFGKCDDDECVDDSFHKFRLELTTDDFGDETSFKVMRRRNGRFNKKVFSGSGYESSTDYTEVKCLKKNGCYKLVILDSHGDGLCCDYGAGSYKAYWKDTSISHPPQFNDGMKSISKFGKCG